MSDVRMSTWLLKLGNGASQISPGRTLHEGLVWSYRPTSSIAWRSRGVRPYSHWIEAAVVPRRHRAHCRKTWRYLENRKYTTYYNATRGGSSHGHRQHTEKTWWSLEWNMVTYRPTDRQTLWSQYILWKKTQLCHHATNVALRGNFRNQISWWTAPVTVYTGSV